LMISIFLLPLRIQNVIPEGVLFSIFSNVEVIVGCNKQFYKDLEECMAKAGEGEVLIGAAFTKIAEFFKMYTMYCSNQANALQTIEDTKKKDKKFRECLDICHKDPKCRGLFLQSFLIKPIQRVCKYPLLLRELIRYTPEDHPDYAPLNGAMAKINEVVGKINEGQRMLEGLHRIVELQSQIEGVQDLIAPNRRLHFEGDLDLHKSFKSKGEPRHIFLFSDLIVLTVQKAADRWEHKLSVKLDQCRLIVGSEIESRASFELIQKDLKTKCILSAIDTGDVNQWIKEIRIRTKEFQKRQLLDIQKQQQQQQQQQQKLSNSVM